MHHDTERMKLHEIVGSIKKETENKNHVVRVCVTRSRTTEEFYQRFKKEAPGFLELVDLDLTSFMMAEKNEMSHNPGQVMPVGGKMKPSESLNKAAVRQLLNETHLNPAGPIVNLGDMEYKIPGRDQENHAHFVGTRILPTDRPFSINPDADKIKRFHYFSLGQLDELLVKKKVQHAGKPVELLDSLQIPLENSKEHGHDYDAATKINLEIINFAQKAEAQKKQSVLRQLFKSSEELFKNYNLEEEVKIWKRVLAGDRLPGANHVEGEVPHPRSSPDLYAVQWVWREVILRLKEQGADPNEVRLALFKAIDLDNFSEAIKESEHGSGFASELEAGLYFIGVLLDTYHLDEEFLRIAKESKHLLGLVESIEKFIKILVPGDQDIKSSLSSLANILIEASSPDKSVLTQKVEQAFCEAFHLNPTDLARKLNSIDEFIDGLTNNAINPLIQGEYSSNRIKQNNEIRRAGLVTLLRKAFPSLDGSWKERYRASSDSKKISLKSVIFEARRKLILLALLSPAEDYYRGKEMINDKIEPLYNNFRTGANYKFDLVKIFDGEGNLKDVEVKMVSDSGEGDNFEFDEYTSEPHSTLRIYHTDGGNYYVEEDKPLPKTWESFARKMLVRGYDDPEEIADIFRRSIILAQAETRGLSAEDAAQRRSRLYRRETRFIPNVFIRESEDSEESLAGEITDVAAVLDIVEQFARQPNTRVVDYKPTPNPGETIKSYSPGGGAELRFAKFYIEHTTPDGEIHKEEVQIYSPGEDGQPSAFYYKTKKEEDDKRYFLKRLLRTKGRHSVIDILFPVRIYGLPIFEAKKKMEEKS